MPQSYRQKHKTIDKNVKLHKRVAPMKQAAHDNDKKVFKISRI